MIKNRIRELRARHQMKQEELARRVGVRRETIGNLEKGRYNPSLVLAWNTLVFPRAEMAALLADQGFEVKAGGPYDRFSHRVDQAIRRDIITAVKN